MHIEKIEQENKQYYNLILEYQSGEHGRTRDYDTILMQVERERNEKMASMNEQKVLRQQLENLSKTMKSMQVGFYLIVFVNSFVYVFIRLSLINSIDCLSIY